jgi:hypothetical protein
MNYRFSNLLGAPYRGGNVVLHGNDLLSPVGNRVSQVRSAIVQHACGSTLDKPSGANAEKSWLACVTMQINLVESTSSTLPFENAKHVGSDVMPAHPHWPPWTPFIRELSGANRFSSSFAGQDNLCEPERPAPIFDR